MQSKPGAFRRTPADVAKIPTDGKREIFT